MSFWLDSASSTTLSQTAHGPAEAKLRCQSKVQRCAKGAAGRHGEAARGFGRWLKLRRDRGVLQKIWRLGIGVLFGCFGRKIDGPG